MVPTGGDTGASLTTRPSGAFSLAGMQDKIGKNCGSIPSACETDVVERNRALLQNLREETRREWQEPSDDVHQRARWQKRQWASGSSASASASASAALDNDTDATGKWQQLNHAVPPAFRFQDHDEVMPLYWSEGSLADKNALAKATPSRMLSNPTSVQIEPAERPAKRQRQDKQCEATSAVEHPIITGAAAVPLVLTISIYSRRLKRSTRASRQRLAAEQRLLEHQDSKREDEQEGEDAPVIHEPLFEPGFGLCATNGGEEHDIEPAPTQVLEISSDQTLADLCNAIYCRIGHLPERDVDQRHFTGRKIPESDRAVLIEDVLYSRSRSTPLPQNATYNQTPLDQMTLSTLPKLHLHKPYHYLHHGICEHLWTIDEVRVSSSQTALTTYLATYALQHPLSILARTKASDTHYPLATCFICDRYSAKYLVVGGASGDDDSPLSLPALKEQVTPMCPSCLLVFAGEMPDKKPQRRKQVKTRARKVARDDDDDSSFDAQQLIAQIAQAQAERTAMMMIKFKDNSGSFIVVPLLE